MADIDRRGDDYSSGVNRITMTEVVCLLVTNNNNICELIII